MANLYGFTDGKQAAAVVVSVFDKGNDLAIFDAAEDGSFAPTMQFRAGGGDWDELLWASFLGPNRLVTISQKNSLNDLELEEKRATHQANTGGSSFAAVGGRGELIAIPNQKGIAFLNGETGKQTGMIPLNSSSIPSIAFSQM